MAEWLTAVPAGGVRKRTVPAHSIARDAGDAGAGSAAAPSVAPIEPATGSSQRLGTHMGLPGLHGMGLQASSSAFMELSMTPIEIVSRIFQAIFGKVDMTLTDYMLTMMLVGVRHRLTKPA